MPLAMCFAFAILLLVSAQAALSKAFNDAFTSRPLPRLNTLQSHSAASQSETPHSVYQQSRERSKTFWMEVPEFQPVDDGLADDDSSSGPGVSLAEADYWNIPKNWRLSRQDRQQLNSVIHPRENPPP
jgi:hypothetical protein